MWMQRLIGAVLIVAGVAVIGGETLLLSLPSYDISVLVRLCLLVVSVLTPVALVGVVAGLGLVASPARIVRHARRTAVVRRLKKRRGTAI